MRKVLFNYGVRDFTVADIHDIRYQELREHSEFLFSVVRADPELKPRRLIETASPVAVCEECCIGRVFSAIWPTQSNDIDAC